MPVAVYGSTSNTVPGSTSIVWTPPASSSGKFALVFLATSDADSITTPSGWTRLDYDTDGNMRWGVYYRTLASSSGVTFSGTLANKKAIVGYVLDGVNLSTPINTGEMPAGAVYGTTSATRAIPSGTCAGDRGVVTFVGSRGGSAPSSWDSPSPFTDGADAYNTSSGATTAASAFANYSAGSFGGGVWTADSAEARGVVYTIPINPAATDVTMTAATGDATADGGTVALTAEAILAAIVGTAAADGGAVAFAADGVMSVSVGDAAADGGTVTMTGAATMSAVGGTAAADGGSVTITGAAVMSAGTGDAAADGGSVTMSGGSSSTMSVLGGTAAADGAAVTITAGATMGIAGGSAAADGGTVTSTASATMTAATGDAAASGGTVTLAGAAGAMMTVAEGSAVADGGTVTILAGATLAVTAGGALAEGGVVVLRNVPVVIPDAFILSGSADRFALESSTPSRILTSSTPRLVMEGRNP